MTDRGHQQLGKLLFAVSHPPKDMETFVETLISDQGRTIDELLQDNIFKWFPIVEACYMDSYVYVSSHDSEDNDSNKYLPLLHMAMLLVTSPAALVSDGGPVFDQMTFHTDLHKAINALLAVVSLNAKAHVHLIQTLGIVALYEFGIGAFEQAHRTLTSAFVMTSLCREYGVDMEAQLTWKLCLMTLDVMIAMSTHSRPCGSAMGYDRHLLPLICDSNHPVRKEVGWMMKRYDHHGYECSSEEAVQRLVEMHEGVVSARRILQRNNGKGDRPIYGSVFDSDSDSDVEPGTSRSRYRGNTRSAVEEEKLTMLDDKGNITVPDYWKGHDPQVLSLSAMLVHEYHEGLPKNGGGHAPERTDWRDKCENVALKACAALLTKSRRADVDIRQLSMVSVFCIMHNMTIIVKDHNSDYAIKRAKTFLPVMNKFAARWPFAHFYRDYLKRYIAFAENIWDGPLDYEMGSKW
ncbi:hypothetical protein FPSE_06805 [Fusarium pseudograminearum CS3096]|uniref:Transcription factor domain-containing protein n=1 Tax=Fusarium pseudograminearum (strain CS3096) TaxID=1028729 RepID=K3VFN0_FUSPC|nr:hypothetical protein FPSE_06805 [Fusarium pseudograminearum CS3096]EKJ73017.1 hypothetical protein FPSE_06805 [Fusarium pseudograminearum CS3096]